MKTYFCKEETKHVRHNCWCYGGNLEFHSCRYLALDYCNHMGHTVHCTPQAYNLAWFHRFLLWILLLSADRWSNRYFVSTDVAWTGGGAYHYRRSGLCRVEKQTVVTKEQELPKSIALRGFFVTIFIYNEKDFMTKKDKILNFTWQDVNISGNMKTVIGVYLC